MAHFSLCSLAHTRVELAGHSERAPEVLTEDVSVGWGPSLGLVFHSGGGREPAFPQGSEKTAYWSLHLVPQTPGHRHWHKWLLDMKGAFNEPSNRLSGEPLRLPSQYSPGSGGDCWEERK